MVSEELCILHRTSSVYTHLQLAFIYKDFKLRHTIVKNRPKKKKSTMQSSYILLFLSWIKQLASDSIIKITNLLITAQVSKIWTDIIT